MFLPGSLEIKQLYLENKLRVFLLAMTSDPLYSALEINLLHGEINLLHGGINLLHGRISLLQGGINQLLCLPLAKHVICDH